MAIDIVCGQTINEHQALALGLVSEFNGKTYFFCSPECKRKFDAEPLRALESPEQGQICSTRLWNSRNTIEF